jgi:hypothetical protein
MAAQERDGESQQHTSLLVTAGPKLESQKDDYGVAKKTSHISDSSRLTTTCFQPVLLGLMDFSAHMHPQSLTTMMAIYPILQVLYMETVTGHFLRTST